REPAIPAYSPLERDFYHAGRLADFVPMHFTRALNYRDAIERMYELGIRTFVDCSTGATLKGIVKRVLAGNRNVVIKAAFDEQMLGTATRSRLLPSSVITTSVTTNKCPANEDNRTEGDIPIAIVGLGCVLPGAGNVPALWENVKNGVSSI